MVCDDVRLLYMVVVQGRRGGHNSSSRLFQTSIWLPKLSRRLPSEGCEIHIRVDGVQDGIIRRASTISRGNNLIFIFSGSLKRESKCQV